MSLCDNNTSFIHIAMKERGAKNRIDDIVTDSGEVLRDPNVIEVEIVRFYKYLLGTRVSLFGMNPKVMARGHLVRRDEATELMKDVSWKKLTMQCGQ